MQNEKIRLRQIRLIDMAISAILFDSIQDYAHWHAMHNALQWFADLAEKHLHSWRGEHDEIALQSLNDFRYLALPLQIVRDIQSSVAIRFPKTEDKVDIIDIFGDSQPGRKLKPKAVNRWLGLLQEVQFTRQMPLHNVVDFVDAQLSSGTMGGSASSSSWHSDILFDLGVAAHIERQLWAFDELKISGKMSLTFKLTDAAKPLALATLQKDNLDVPSAYRQPIFANYPNFAWMIRPLSTTLDGFKDFRDAVEKKSKGNNDRHAKAKKKKTPYLKVAEKDELLFSKNDLSFFRSGRLKYPMPPASRADLEACWKAEAHLASIFSTFRKGWAELATIRPEQGGKPADMTSSSAGANISPEELWRRLDLRYTPHRTLESSLQPTAPPGVKVSSDPASHEGYVVPFAQSGSDFEIPCRLVPAKGKEKVKTRGVPITEEVLGDVDDAVAEASVKIIHELKDPYCHTLQSLFEVSLGESSWTDLLKAFAEVGFSIQKLQGSAWFIGPGEELQQAFPTVYQRSFILHDPHPKKKIEPYIAYGISKRLRDIYGWSRDTIVLPAPTKSPAPNADAAGEERGADGPAADDDEDFIIQG